MNFPANATPAQMEAALTRLLQLASASGRGARLGKLTIDVRLQDPESGQEVQLSEGGFLVDALDVSLPATPQEQPQFAVTQRHAPRRGTQARPLSASTAGTVVQFPAKRRFNEAAKVLGGQG
jgi:hypothetical protein